MPDNIFESFPMGSGSATIPLSSPGETGQRFAGLSLFPAPTLRTKYVTFACLVSLFAALVLGGYNFYWVNRLAVEQATDHLSVSAQLIAPQIKASYERMSNDAIAVSQMPPFQGLIRSINNNGIDPLDSSTVGQWRRRLQTIFTAILKRRSDYVEMRFIGIADGGRELVRTDRKGRSIVNVRVEDLQRMGDQPFFRDSTRVGPDHIYFSDVTANVDHGIPNEKLYVVRSVIQIRTPAGKLFGLMVINAHYETLIRGTLAGLDAEDVIYVVDASGHYVKRSADGTVSHLVLPSDPNYELPHKLRARLASGQQFETGLQNGMLFSHALVRIDQNDRGKNVVVLVASPRDKALKSATAIQHRALGLSLLFVALTALLAFAVSAYVTRPMHRVIEAINTHQPDGRPLDLPVTRRDEIGQLSRAFTGLLASLDSAQKVSRQAELDLMRAERMASLGSLVAGVAHELNTPIGVAVTVASTLSEKVTTFASEIEAGQVRRSAINDHLSAMQDGTTIMLRGLERASELITQFKHVAVDQASEQRRGFSLADHVNEIVSMMQTQFKHSSVTLRAEIPADVQLNSYPGALGQVLMNLVNNARIHGFDEDGAGEVVVSATAVESAHVRIIVRDSGNGMDEATKVKIFEPFFTTKLGKGGSGLGLSIVFNIVSTFLGGDICCESAPGLGTKMIVTIPATAPANLKET